jgi:hypothetical protein
MAFGTQVRGFKPGQSRRIFQGEKNPQRAAERNVILIAVSTSSMK